MKGRTLLLTAIILSTFTLIGSQVLPNPVIPSVRAATNTVSLALSANSLGWNFSSPQGKNPTITVTRGDNVSITITHNETGVDQLHQFAIDVDNDGPQCRYDFNPIYPDLCSEVSTLNGVVIQYRFNSTVLHSGNYRYYCFFHPTTMAGDFIVLPRGPDFTIAANATILHIQPGHWASLKITATSIRGFQGNISLSDFRWPDPYIPFEHEPSVANISLSPGETASTNFNISALPVANQGTLIIAGRTGTLFRYVWVGLDESEKPTIYAPSQLSLFDLIETLAIAAAVTVPAIYFVWRSRYLSGLPKNQPTDAL